MLHDKARNSRSAAPAPATVTDWSPAGSESVQYYKQ